MIGNCEWESEFGKRCRYPGAWSSSTNGTGKWFCVAHSECHDGHAGAQIVDQSIVDCGEFPDYSVEARRKHFLRGIDASAPPATKEHAAACFADLKAMLRASIGRKPGKGLSITLANSPRDFIEEMEEGIL